MKIPKSIETGGEKVTSFSSLKRKAFVEYNQSGHIVVYPILTSHSYMVLFYT